MWHSFADCECTWACDYQLTLFLFESTLQMVNYMYSFICSLFGIDLPAELEASKACMSFVHV